MGRPHELLPWLRQVERPARMVYEAGPTGYGLARRARAEGIELAVCAPGKTERPPADGVKTDKRDAIRLARLLAAGTEPDILSAGSWPLSAPVQPICWHGGPVMNANETFTLAWEGQAPNTYWSSSKDYVQSFLSDVASASGSLASPYADTTQYWDGSSVQDRAANSSVFGGGCDDSSLRRCRR